MRHSSLRFGAIGLVCAIGACTASGSDDQSHGPVFGPNDGGADAGARDGDLPDTAQGGDGATPPPPDDAGSDATPPPGDSGGQDTGVDAGGCTDKTAVLAASATTFTQSVAAGTGAWTTGSVNGTFRGGAAVVPFGTGFHGVVIGAANALQWTAWSGASWSAPAAIGGIAVAGVPALATIGTSVHLVYRDGTAKYFHGTFNAGAWDAALDPVGGAAAQSFGPTGVGMDNVAGALLFAHAGGNNTNLFAEGLAAGTGKQIGTANTEALVPSLIALNGSANDAMVVYVHLGDFRVSWATRAAGTWTDHGAIDTTLFTGTGIPVAAAALPGGKAVIAFQGSNGKAYAVTFDGTTWALPATNLDPGALGGLPAVSPGACGDDAVVALPMASGAVKTARLKGGTWTTAADVTGTVASNVVAIATTK
jgi:hypothetical protein